MIKNIIYICIFIFEAMVAYHYYDVLFENVKSLKTRLITFAVGYSILMGISFFNEPILNLIFFLFVNMICAFICYKRKFVSVLFYSVMMSCFMIISETIVIWIYNIFGIVTEVAYTSEISFVIEAISSKLLFLVLTQLVLQLAKKNKGSDRSQYVFLLCILPVSSMFLLNGILKLTLNNDVERKAGVLLSIGSILLLFSNFFVFFVYEKIKNKNAKIAALEIQNQKQKLNEEYYSVLHKQIDDSRILIHDIKKHFNSIRIYAAKNDCGKIDKYIDNISDEFHLNEKLSVTKSNMFDAIIYHYYKLCQDKKIKFTAENNGVSFDFMDDSDLISLLTNSLDNAVEACSNTEDKSIKLNCFLQNESLTVIRVINNCSIKPIKRNGKLITSKNDKELHGYGIKSIERIAEKYNGTVNLNFDEKIDEFNTVIVLKNNIYKPS